MESVGRRRLRAPGGRASRLELYAVAAIVLVLGFGSVGGAVVIASTDSGTDASASTTTTEMVETTTTVAPTVTSPPTTEAPPPTAPAATWMAPAPGEYVETFTPPPMTAPPPPGPSSRPCTVPNLQTLGTGTPADLVTRGLSLISSSGCRTPIETDCINPAVPAGMMREVSQSPASGTVIDSNAFWYHTVHWSPSLASSMGRTYPPC